MTEQTKHTPGPWTVGELPNREYYIKSEIAYRNGYPVIAETQHISGFRIGYSEDNARLIASAPDLLEACKHCFKTLEHISKDYLKGYSIKCHDGKGSICIGSMIDACQEAITKAEGGDS